MPGTFPDGAEDEGPDDDGESVLALVKAIVHSVHGVGISSQR
jgi:hypothetical protein